MSREPTIGGFIVLVIKNEYEMIYKDFDIFGFGVNTVYQWTHGLARPAFDDILLILKHYNKDISTATAQAEILRAKYRSEQRDLERNKKTA